MAQLLALVDLACDGGTRRLFAHLDLAVADGERLALVGANGSGKSTLLRVCAGTHEPDQGERRPRRDLLAVVVAQEERFAPGATLHGELLAAAQAAGDGPAEAAGRIERLLGELPPVDPELRLDQASGGWRKRCALAAALLRRADLLLLDEPTNHLDLAAVRWLEDRLTAREAPAQILVSHDRWFLQRVATRCCELGDRFPDGHFQAAGGYEAFCERRDAFLEEQRATQHKLAGQMRKEEAWLARRPKARTTKSVARVKEAGRLAAELEELGRRNAVDRSEVRFAASGRQANDLVLAEGIAKAFGSTVCFRDLDLHLAAGDRVGLLGANGSGKSTLLKVLAGQLDVDAGRIKRAHELRVAYADQDRSDLDGALTVARTLCPNGDMVEVGGSRYHVRAWAARHGLRPEQLAQRVGELSGGERARVQVARLALRPADLLLLDEPTNDLDIPLLELLEEALLDFAGAVVLVSHDRWLLDRVCDRLYGFDGRGGVRQVVSIADYEQSCRAVTAAPEPVTADPETTAARPAALSWEEQKELRGLPGRIESAEQRLASADAALLDPDTYGSSTRSATAMAEREAARSAVEELYARWEELEGRG